MLRQILSQRQDVWQIFSFRMKLRERAAQPAKGTPAEVACALRKHAGSFWAPRKLTFTRRISALRCRSPSVSSKHSSPSHTYTTLLTHGGKQAVKRAHADAGFARVRSQSRRKHPSSHHSPQNLVQILNNYASVTSDSLSTAYITKKKKKKP